jgi:hypothetical protein
MNSKFRSLIILLLIFVTVGCGPVNRDIGQEHYVKLWKTEVQFAGTLPNGLSLYVVQPRFKNVFSDSGYLLDSKNIIVEKLDEESVKKYQNQLGQYPASKNAFSQNINSKYQIGQNLHDVNNSDVGNPIFKYKKSFFYKCGLQGDWVGRIISQDPAYVYFVPSAGGANLTIGCIVSVQELDQLEAQLEREAVDKKNQYEKNLAKSKEQVKSRIDVVAQVLNYSSGCKDDGCDTYTWAAKDAKQCIYEKVSFNRGDSGYAQVQQLIQVIQAVNSPAFGITGSAGNIIKLNELDPKSLKIATINHTTTERKEIHDPKNYFNVIGYNNIQHEFQTQDVQYMGKPIFSQQNLDISRLRRGWSLIYSNYCSGTKKAF